MNTARISASFSQAIRSAAILDITQLNAEHARFARSRPEPSAVQICPALSSVAAAHHSSSATGQALLVDAPAASSCAHR